MSIIDRSKVTLQAQSPTERAVVASALNLLSIHHEKAITVSQLIKAVGVSKSVFYRYFANIEDVYAGILLNDELQLRVLFQQWQESDTSSNMLNQFLKYRLLNADKYRVLLKLEKRLQLSQCKLLKFKQWMELRRLQADDFASLIQSKFARFEKLDKEKLHFYYAFLLVVTAGYVESSETDFFHQLLSDKRRFVKFLQNIMSTIADY